MFFTILRRTSAAVLLVAATSRSARHEPSPAAGATDERAWTPADVDPLRVVRALPTGTAAPNAEIRVTFDRPVAGSLDSSVDPKTVLTIAPAATGTLEWRDPVTMVFTPRTPFTPGASYTVTVANTFHAMDGAQLERPYTFSFRVSGAMLIGGNPVNADLHPALLLPNAKFDLVWSSAVDPARVAANTYIQLSAACPGGGIVRTRALGVRPISAKDDYRLRDAGGYRRDRAADSLRRVVSLAPVAPLPLACAASLVAPVELEQTSSSARVAWAFSTYGPLQLAEASCAGRAQNCPIGPITLRFSTPVRGSAVRRKVSILPAIPFTMSDTARESDVWQLDAPLRPRTTYAVVADTSLRDVFGQKLTGNPAAGVRTTGYMPSVSYPYGRLLVEKEGFGTLAVRHVNVDTLVITAAPVPDSLETSFLRTSVWSWGSLWQQIAPSATIVRIPTHAALDVPTITGVKLPAIAGAGGRRGLIAIRINGPNDVKLEDNVSNIALVQVTDLAVHAKVGAASAVVWITRVSDGLAVSGATVSIYDQRGKVVATGRSDAQGLASFPTLQRAAVTDAANDEEEGGDESNVDGYVGATLGDDRALVGVSQYDPDLSPWQFGVYSAWGTQRLPLAGAVFTERGIYRPGEPLYAKAIVRRGALGALGSPAAGDSVRWVFKDREDGVIRDTVVRLSAYGTAAYTLPLPRSLALGYYRVELQYHWQGTWVSLDGTGYRVAEYRPPEFLVDVTAPKAPMLPGDSMRTTVEARYLFGAPMGRAAFGWNVQRTIVSPWALEIPGLEQGDWYVGETGWWWENDSSDDAVETVASGVDTLDASGRRQIRVAVPAPTKGRAAIVTFTAQVTDVNRQTVANRTSVTVHPADFYIAAKPAGESYFWRAGDRQGVQLIAVRPTGEHVAGVSVRGTVVRREWHQVHRERDGAAEVVGEWVSDTVAHCAVTTTADPQRCEFMPAQGGSYIVYFEAKDARGRDARTSLYRWATGSEWVPWEDESRFRMDVIADKSRYTVGDTATVMLASPFTGAEAWLTVEREGVIEQRRMTLGSGSTLVRFPITEAFVPNAYVSVVVARGRSAPPGHLDDPGRPTMRVGYAQLRVTPEVKRLTVKVQPLASEYLPGDSARIRLNVTDSRGGGGAARR